MISNPILDAPIGLRRITVGVLASLRAPGPPSVGYAAAEAQHRSPHALTDESRRGDARRSSRPSARGTTNARQHVRAARRTRDVKRVPSVSARDGFSRFERMLELQTRCVRR